MKSHFKISAQRLAIWFRFFMLLLCSSRQMPWCSTGKISFLPNSTHMTIGWDEGNRLVQQKAWLPCLVTGKHFVMNNWMLGRVCPYHNLKISYSPWLGFESVTSLMWLLHCTTVPICLIGNNNKVRKKYN